MHEHELLPIYRGFKLSVQCSKCKKTYRMNRHYYSVLSYSMMVAVYPACGFIFLSLSPMLRSFPDAIGYIFAGCITAGLICLYMLLANLVVFLLIRKRVPKWFWSRFVRFSSDDDW